MGEKENIKLNGIILSCGLVGEYDKRLVILTKERGKITAFVKGVRRGNNTLISKTQMFVMGTFELREGRNAYTLYNIEAKEYFHELVADIDKYCYASYFCEVMSYFTHEGENATDYLNLLFVSLNALKKNMLDVKLIRYIYEIKIMDVFGQGIQTHHCPICGNDKLSNIYDAVSGGILCDNCRGKAHRPYHLSGDGVYGLQLINSAELGRLYSYRMTDSVMEELRYVSSDFMKVHINREFKSAQIIETLG